MYAKEDLNSLKKVGRKIDTLTVLNQKVNQKNMGYFLVFLFSVCLNQTSIVGTINYSFSDIFVLLLLIFMLMKGIRVPGYHFVYFLLLSAILAITTFFYTPFSFSVNVETSQSIKEYLKILVVFLYFIIGYNLSSKKMIDITLKWYSYTALFVGGLGILIFILGFRFLYGFYDFGPDRFNGFMNDPNYFAIVQITALPYLVRAGNISFSRKLIIYFIILISILLSGSKTGIITLMIFTVFFILGELMKNKIQAKIVLFTIFAIIAFTFITIILQFIDTKFSLNLNKNVQFQRLTLLFTDFDAAFNENGSSRLPIWEAGLQLISTSPLIGVGAGMYSVVSGKLTGVYAVAHNTYLQLFSEWGGILATIYFLYIAVLLGKVTFTSQAKSSVNLVLRDILFILLIGSIGVSFNNARMFWFFLGALVFSVAVPKKVNGEITSLD